MIEILLDGDALDCLPAPEIIALTRRATDATYYAEGLTAEQVESIERVVRMAPDCVAEAAANPNQQLVAAAMDGAVAGFVIATVHGEDDRELDWIMVDPAMHGTGIGSALLQAGIAWLGEHRPIWLNVIRHNARAIAFYRKHGFEIDPLATTHHAIPHYIMRRTA